MKSTGNPKGSTDRQHAGDWVRMLGTVLVVAAGFAACTEGTRQNALRDVRQAERGDTMHPGVEVVLPDADGKLRRRPSADPALRAMRDLPLLPEGAGKAAGDDRFEADWQARMLAPGVQEVRVRWDNGDRGYDFVYRNEGGRLVPVSSRASHAGYMFDAMPWAALAMLATGLLYGLLVARVRRSRGKPGHG